MSSFSEINGLLKNTLLTVYWITIQKIINDVLLYFCSILGRNLHTIFYWRMFPKNITIGQCTGQQCNLNHICALIKYKHVHV